MTERVDLYKGVHKGIRRMLSELVDRAGTTDFASDDDVAELERTMTSAFALLETHAHKEDRFIMPLAKSHDPALVAELDAAHHEHDEAFASLTARIAAIRERRTNDPRAGHELVIAISRLVGELYDHMADEEDRVQPLLWRTHDDATLGQTEGTLVGSIPPDVLMGFLVYMLPAMSAPERAGFIRNMSRGAPPAAVLGVIEVAKQVLRPADMSRLTDSIADVIPRAA